MRNGLVRVLGGILEVLGQGHAILHGHVTDEELAQAEVLDDNDQPVTDVAQKRIILGQRAVDEAAGRVQNVLLQATLAEAIFGPLLERQEQPQEEGVNTEQGEAA